MCGPVDDLVNSRIVCPVVDQILPILSNDEVEIALIRRLEILSAEEDAVRLRVRGRLGLGEGSLHGIVAALDRVRGIPVDSGRPCSDMNARSHADELRIGDLPALRRRSWVDTACPASDLYAAFIHELVGIRSLGSRGRRGEQKYRSS